MWTAAGRNSNSIKFGEQIHEKGLCIDIFSIPNCDFKHIPENSLRKVFHHILKWFLGTGTGLCLKDWYTFLHFSA